MAFTFKTKKQATPLQTAASSFAQGFAAGGVKAMQDQLVLRKENAKVFNKLKSTVSQLTASARQHGDVKLEKALLTFQVNLDLNSFNTIADARTALIETGVLLDYTIIEDGGLTRLEKIEPRGEMVTFTDDSGAKKRKFFTQEEITSGIVISPAEAETKIIIVTHDDLSQTTMNVPISYLEPEYDTKGEKITGGGLVTKETPIPDIELISVRDSQDNMNKHIELSKYNDDPSRYRKIDKWEITSELRNLMSERGRLLARMKGGEFIVNFGGATMVYKDDKKPFLAEDQERLKVIENRLVTQYGYDWIRPAEKEPSQKPYHGAPDTKTPPIQKTITVEQRFDELKNAGFSEDDIYIELEKEGYGTLKIKEEVVETTTLSDEEIKDFFKKELGGMPQFFEWEEKTQKEIGRKFDSWKESYDYYIQSKNK